MRSPKIKSESINQGGGRIKVAVDAGMEWRLYVIGLRTFGLEIQAPRAHLNDPNIARFQVD